MIAFCEDFVYFLVGGGGFVGDVFWVFFGVCECFLESLWVMFGGYF